MIVKPIECKTAEEFISKLTLGGMTYKYMESDYCLYRGVGVGSGPEEHRLIPSAFRLDNFSDLFRLAGMPEYVARSYKREEEWLEIVQNNLEVNILGYFFRFADAQGLPMPEITSEVRRKLQLPGTSSQLSAPLFSKVHLWPPDILLPLAGQAQHYGLPTRLLDWSRDPWAATYFAAKGGMDRLKSDSSSVGESCIAVWILDVDSIGHENLLVDEHVGAKGNELPLTLVTAPAYTNPNLRAQHGMFTVWRRPIERGINLPLDLRPLDELLTEAYEGCKATAPPLYKLTLSLKHVSSLWDILRRNGVNAARLFPSFDGAAKAVREDANFGNRGQIKKDNN